MSEAKVRNASYESVVRESFAGVTTAIVDSTCGCALRHHGRDDDARRGAADAGSGVSAAASAPKDLLPGWVRWEQRPFPDANLLLLEGRARALVDSGFVGHAVDTAAWADEHAGPVELVVKTQWQSDHVGGNALLQSRGAGIAASAPDAQALQRRDPRRCVAEYLDQPVAPVHGRRAAARRPGGHARIGRMAGRGHSRPHRGAPAPVQPEERALVVGDALSDYDVGG
jgi:glyoxylase-like metal-dependent hydrolase (beta-lactamase superfamily II)